MWATQHRGAALGRERKLWAQQGALGMHDRSTPIRCHAGEYEAPEPGLGVPRPAPALAPGVSESPGARGLKPVGAAPASPSYSSPLLQELFSDLRRFTGAAVIAAAGGAQYSYERGNLKNGVFTYSVLEGLEQGKRKVSELRDYVTQRVQELTKGRQTPTMRRENLDFDFDVL